MVGLTPLLMSTIFYSVASPVFFGNADETEQINVSKSGTLRLMGFAQAANVKKM